MPLLLLSRALQRKGSSQRLGVVAALGRGKSLHLCQNTFFMSPGIEGGIYSAQNIFFPPTSTYLLFFPKCFQHKSPFTLSGHIFKGKKYVSKRAVQEMNR